MTTLNRRSMVLAGVAAAAGGATEGRAQAWPAKPIRWVVPYTAGGLTDVVTRLVLSKMNVGQPFVVDNKPGANALIAAEFVANAPPDGYVHHGTSDEQDALCRQDEVRPREELRADFARERIAAHHLRVQRPSREDRRRVDRVRKEEPGQNLLRIDRDWGGRSPHDGTDQADCRHRHGARALQGNCAGAGRPGVRQHPAAAGGAYRRHEPDQRGQDSGAGAPRQGSQRSRNPEGRPSLRPAGRCSSRRRARPGRSSTRSRRLQPRR